MRLYHVECRGMRDGHGVAFVVASDPTTAYQILLNHLYEKGFGFSRDREMERITLLADTESYGTDLQKLFLMKN